MYITTRRRGKARVLKKTQVSILSEFPDCEVHISILSPVIKTLVGYK